MQKLSGLVLDRYDDADGTLRSHATEEWAKYAHRFTSDELARLPDETFALVIQDGDVVMKKFSMADMGNLGLSIEYFFEHGHKLPVEAQKVAATNLLRGCQWYGIMPRQDEELHKIAFGPLALLNTALMAPGAAREAKNNLQTVRGAGPGIMTPQQIKARRLQTMGV